MSATITRPRPSTQSPVPHDDHSPATPPQARPLVSDDLLTLALGLLMLAAIVPLRSVFIGAEWVRPVIGGVILSLGIGWGARRLGVGPITHLVMTTISLLIFITIAFLPTTAIGGLLPTATTLSSLRDLFLRGLELVELRPSPTFAEAGLLLLAVSGTWIVSYLADGMLFVLRSPLKAIACALVMWAVPLAVAPTSSSITLPAAAILGASAVMMLLGNALFTGSYGVRVTAPGQDGRPRSAPVIPLPGWTLAVAAVVVGLVFASILPGFTDDPLYAARGGTGTTITTNPIVDIRKRLVASNTGPVILVNSPRPIYLRTTALDRYDSDEQWTAGTISGQRVSGVVDSPPPVPVERVEVGVEIAPNIEGGAVLAPAPYQPIIVSGPKAEVLRYDRRSSTLTVPGDATLVAGDSYVVEAAIPQPTADALRTIAAPGPGTANTELPANVPAEVSALSRQIVDQAGAVSMFDQALAVQNVLRTWTYSTQPDSGLGATAMLQFINSQTGYCEQFAGTMAVMLRTLGIPARLAVGYTPGTLQADGRWEVTNGNAHAWVEVNFGESGWIPFEPTPRTDGNVLVTSATAVVPSQTQAQQQGLDSGPGVEPVGPGDLSSLLNQPQSLPSQDPFALEPGASSGSGDSGGGVGWALVLVLLGVAGVGGVVLVRSRETIDTAAPPAQRILTAKRRVELVGRAVGRPRHPAETDEEYCARIADGSRAGMTLARPATRAVYAPAVTREEAGEAESAGKVLSHRLTVDLPAWRKALVRARTVLGR
ncbi:MAG: transglutaminaseTgpA domain-containing protein [Euzebya sp.]